MYLIIYTANSGYYKFFDSLAKKLYEEGSSVYAATDAKNPYRVKEEDISKPIVSTYNFSVYEGSVLPNDKRLKKYHKYNLSSTLLSDFERASVFGVNLRKREQGYYVELINNMLIYFEEIMLKNEIKKILYENVSNTFSYIAYIVAKELGVEYVGITSSRLPNRFWITSDPLEESKILNERLEDVLKQDVDLDDPGWVRSREYLMNIKNIQPDYMKTNGLDNLSLTRFFVAGKYIRLLKAIISSMDKSALSYRLGNPLTYMIFRAKRQVLRNLRVKPLARLYSKTNKGERFFLYPLHYHPEASTSILSPSYVDEFHVIQNISFNLPHSTTLYVKDHVSAYGYMPLDFYKKITELPNVKLLSPREDTKSLISRSLAVITLTSTVGYEASLLNKRTLLFGRVFYESHPLVTKITYDNLFDEMEKVVVNDEVLLEKDFNIRFVKAFFDVTLEGSLNFNSYDKVFLDKVVETIAD